MQDCPGIKSLEADKVSVYEAFHSSAVQKSLYGVKLTCIHGTQFYSKLQEGSMHVQCTSRELDGQFLFPLWSLEEGIAFRGKGKRCVYRFTIICISLYFEYSEPIY